MAEGSTPLACPHCEFVAKGPSDFGLKAHIRYKHSGAEDERRGPGRPRLPRDDDGRIIRDRESGAAGPGNASPGDPAPDPGSVDPGDAPERHKRTVREVFAGLRRKAKPEPSSTGEKPPRSAKWGKTTRRGRTPVGPLFESLYTGLGHKLTTGGGPNVAVGRTLTFQAPIAASRADDMIKGTLVDRFVQPAAKLYDSGEDAFAIAGFPALVWAWQAFPDARRVLNMPMRAAVLANLEELVPAMEKAAKREAELTAKVEMLAPMLFPDGMPTDGDGRPLDLVSAMLSNIFRDVETGTVPREGVSENGNSGASGPERSDVDSARAGGTGPTAQ